MKVMPESWQTKIGMPKKTAANSRGSWWIIAARPDQRTEFMSLAKQEASIRWQPSRETIGKPR